MTKAPTVDTPPPATDDTPGEGVAAEEEYTARVLRIMALIEADPTMRDRVLCEIYVTLAEFSEQFRTMEAQMKNMGPGGILKMLRGKGMPSEE